MTRIGFSCLAHTLCLGLMIVSHSSQSYASNDMVFICEGDQTLHWDKRVGKDSTPKVFDIPNARRKVLISQNTVTIFQNEDEWITIGKQDPGYYSRSDGSTNYTFFGGFLDNFYSFHHKRNYYNEGYRTTLSVGMLEGNSFTVSKYYCF